MTPTALWGRWQESKAKMQPNRNRIWIALFVVAVLVWLTLLTFPQLVPNVPVLNPAALCDNDPDTSYPACLE
jgi:hypothetical protein